MARITAVSILFLLGVSALSCMGQEDIMDVELLQQLMDDEAIGLGRMLLQSAGGYGSYNGGGSYGAYGYGYEYGAAAEAGLGLQSVQYRQVCTQQTNPTTLQAFVALLEPVQVSNDSEVAQDAPSGMVTMFVNTRTGDVYVSGTVNNLQNLTAISLHAGNTTENGPVVLPLLPSASAINVNGTMTTVANLTQNSTLIEALANATLNGTSNNRAAGNTSDTTGSTAGTAGDESQAPQVTVMSFNPPLPWLATMVFSQKVNINSTLPLVANATVNNSASTTDAAGANGDAPASGQERGDANTTSNAAEAAGPDSNLSGNQMGIPAFSYVNLTQLINRLRQENATVTTLTTYAANGSTVSVTSINGSNTNTTGVGAGAAGQEAGAANTAGNNAGAAQYRSTNIVPLLQAGLAYVSVHSSQSGQNAELRGQVMPYGKVTGASPTIAAHFPDALVPAPTYNTTTCRNVPVPAPQPERATGTTDIEGADTVGADPIGNNFANNARKVLPAVAAAMVDVATRDNANMQGNYSVFTAAVQAAALDSQERGAQAANAGPAGTASVGAGGANAGTAGNVGPNGAAASGNVGAAGNNAGAAGSVGPDGAAVSGNTGAGRRLLQAQAGAAGTSASNSNNIGKNITVFAPTNQAINSFLASANLTTAQFLANKTLLTKVLAFHIVPNETLTTAGLAASRRRNNRLNTLLPNNYIGYQPGRNGGNAALYGANNTPSAIIVDANMRAGNNGNVIVHGINKVLTPPDLMMNMASAMAAGNTSANTAAAGGPGNNAANADVAGDVSGNGVSAGGNAGAFGNDGAAAGSVGPGGVAGSAGGAGRRLLKFMHLM